MKNKYHAIVNKKAVVAANNFSTLKRKAATIANQFGLDVDDMEVFVNGVYDSTMIRANTDFTNGKTIRSDWT